MKPARNGERIARAALELFCEVGFKAASVRGIAERSGVSVGNLYNHAFSKEALFDRLFAEHFPGAHIERMFEGVTMGEGLPEAIAKVLGNMARYAESEPYFFRLVMVDLNEFGGEHLRRHGEPYDRPIEELVSAAPGAEGMRGAVEGLRQDIGGCDFTRFFLWLFYAMGFTAAMRKAMTDAGQEDDTFRTLLAVVTRGVTADGGSRGDGKEGRTT